jgi:N utilization substance protein A
LAIGKQGQNVRLAAKLTGWNIDILSNDESKIEAVAEAGDNNGDIEGSLISTIDADTIDSADSEAANDGQVDVLSGRSE